jgi:hypothetical protein
VDVPTKEEVAEMENKVESLKSQVSTAKQELQQLESGVPWCIAILIAKAHRSLIASPPTSEIHTRIAQMNSEVPLS